jgi:MFS family permease
VIRRRRDFSLLWGGQALSQLGGRAFGVAYLLLVLSATGSASDAGLVASVALAAFTAAHGPAGWLADRVDRRRLLTVSDAVSAAAGLSVGAAALAGRFSLPQLIAVAFVLGMGWALRPIAELTALPRTVAPDELPRALALAEARGHATGLAGPVAGGALYSVAPALPFLLHGAALAASLVCDRALRVSLGPERAPERPHRSAFGIGQGFTALWQLPFVRTASALAALNELAINGVGLTVILLLAHRGASGQTIGLVLGLGGLGGLAGALAASRLAGRVPERWALLVPPACGALAVAALAKLSTASAIAAAYGVLLALQPTWHATLTGRFLEVVPEEVRGRVQAATSLVAAGPLIAIPALCGLSVDSAGAAATCLALAGVLVLVAVGVAASDAVRDAVAPRPGTT